MTVESPDGKAVWPVRIPIDGNPFGDEDKYVPSSTRLWDPLMWTQSMWSMPEANRGFPIGSAMNLNMGGDTSGSELNSNTSDDARTPQGQNTGSSSSGSLKVTCKWFAATCNGEDGVWTNDNSTPTDKALRLIVEGTVEAFGSVGEALSTPSDGAVNVDVKGLGADGDTQGGEAHRQNTSSDQSLWRNRSQTKQAVFVLPVPTTPSASGTYEVKFELPGISASSSIQTGFAAIGLATASAYYSIKSVDTRFVRISSDIDQSYRKTTVPPVAKPGETAPPPIVGTNPPIWREAVPGGQPVESVASVTADAVSPANSPVQNPPPAPVPYWVGSTTYTTNLSGVTQPDFKWDFGLPTYGGQDADSFKTASASPIFLLAPASNVEGFPLSSTINVEVIDTDPGSPSTPLTDSYTVNWHLPYENWHKYAPDVQSWVRPSVEVDEPGYARNNEAIGFKWNYEKAALEADTANAVGAGAAIAGAIVEGPVWGGLFAVVGIGASELGKMEPDQTSANFDSCWNDSRSSFDTPPISGLSGQALEDEQDLYRMVPIKLIGYTTVHAKADIYDSHGFAGTGHKNIRKYDGRSASIGNFITAGGGGTNAGN